MFVVIMGALLVLEWLSNVVTCFEPPTIREGHS